MVQRAKMQIGQILFRTPKESDLNFIHSTFLKSIQKESALGRGCSTRVFFSEFPKVIDYILFNSKVLLAVFNEDPNFIYGYLVYQGDTVHYAFTRASSRNLGIAKALIKEVFPDKKSLTFSFKTNSSKKITLKYPELIFNPFNLYMKGAN